MVSERPWGKTKCGLTCKKALRKQENMKLHCMKLWKQNQYCIGDPPPIVGGTIDIGYLPRGDV